MKTCLTTVQRLAEHETSYPEIKDPCVVPLPNDQYILFASIGTSVTQNWQVGRFLSYSPEGPWQELEPVIFKNLTGPQLCAPAVTFDHRDGKDQYTMYIQTTCFAEDGIIAKATSTDGLTFYGETKPLVTKETLDHDGIPVVGVYDAGISEVTGGTEPMLCMIVSGYRKVGNGDIYMTYKKKFAPDSQWTRAKRILTQEDVPFHNPPSFSHYEWGLEGGKIIQLDASCFLLIGVCFLPKSNQFRGMRQRVFFAAATSLEGPFIPLGTPFAPQMYNGKPGEHGHPDTVIKDDTLWVIYQERAGETGKQWHLRHADFNLQNLATYIKQLLEKEKTEKRIAELSQKTHAEKNILDDAPILGAFL